MTSSESLVDNSVSGALAAIARTLQAEPDVETTLAAIVKAAVDQVTGAEYAGISLVDRRQRIRTVAPTDQLVVTLDEVQYRTGQGPCIDAIAEHEVYRTGDLTTEARWPAFTPAAAETGVRSMLCYRLFVSETTLGALNLSSRGLDAFSDQTQREGGVFASHAAIALVGAQTEANLHTALEHRDAIGTAKGILMHRHGIGPAEAFRLLVEASQAANLKLHAVAAWLVDHHREV
ncbi:GAF and ANTAR domain-containing protein [Amycolatopsis thailandensis]|uniref:GAF and ANTAR domain-containing protein n=1 Tax=Amycolatopsis thailandensis TaxID=589330 RepID=UPI0036381786